MVREIECASAFGFLCLAFKPKSACNDGETSGLRPRQFRADAAQREACGLMHLHEGRQLQRCGKRVPTCRYALACRGGHQSKCATMIMMTIRRLIPAARPLAFLWASYNQSGDLFAVRRSSLQLYLLLRFFLRNITSAPERWRLQRRFRLERRKTSSATLNS